MAFSSLVRPNAEAGQQVPPEPEPLARANFQGALSAEVALRREGAHRNRERLCPLSGSEHCCRVSVVNGLSSLCSDCFPSYRRQHHGLPDYGRVDSLDLSDHPVPCWARRVGLCRPASDSAEYAGSLCSRGTSRTGTLGYCRSDRQREPRQAVKVCASTHTLTQNWHHDGSYQHGDAPCPSSSSP